MSAEPRSTTWLADAAARHPDRVALRSGGGDAVTYGELLECARGLAPALAGGGGPVGLELVPGIDHAIAVHAALLAGRPLLTIRPGLPEREREEVLAAGSPGLLLGPADVGRLSVPADPPAAPIPPVDDGAAASGETIVARVLSSGTTGPRRPVDLSAGNFEASARASAANLGIDEADLWLACLPMDHVGGLSILIRSTIYGTAALVHERFSTDAVAAALEGSPRVSIVSLVPTQLARLLDAGADLSGLRVILVGGAALSVELLERSLELDLPVVQTYGLTQACSQVCTLAPGEARRHPGSSGRALPGIEVRIHGGEGPGEIEVRGPIVAPGAAGPDGWLRTGDLGRLDADGYLWVEGRGDDLIVSGGENVRPEPVEERLAAHPDVAEAAVIGRPDSEWGEAVVAIVVPAAGATPDAGALIDHCRGALAPAMVPKRVEIAGELPRTASGKLKRAALRD